MSDIVKIREENGVDIFFDKVAQRFFYWDNGRQKTSVHLQNLINRLNKSNK